MDEPTFYPLSTPLDVTPHALVCLVALGLALAFVSADRHSATSRMLAAAFASMAIAIGLNIVVAIRWEIAPEVSGWFAIAEALAIWTLLEWILRVRRTVPSRDLDTRWGDRMLRVGQAAGVLYALLSIAMPVQRYEVFLGGLARPEVVHGPHFWIFMLPILLAGATGMFSLLLLLNRRPDRPESRRVLAMIGAIPFFAASFVLPLKMSATAMIVGEMIFLLGAVQYHVLQGQRGQFMSRFLSPQVARLVSERGLQGAMQETSLPITVVCCDLRGFTRYAQEHESAKVLTLLRHYYDVVGQAVAEFGATIKDFAGDGVLVLVGAPIRDPEHARHGVELARQIRDAVGVLLRGHPESAAPLGIGVGVASGSVTVGVIGSSGRYEYTAVGPAVNLASRLCDMAADAEVLVSAETIDAVGDEAHTALEQRTPVQVKGYAQPVAHFNVASAAA